MSHALFLNGVFEDVLEEVINAQEKDENLVCVLQPYSGRIIRHLASNDFKEQSSIPFYISITTNLQHVCYVAEIVGWENKRELPQNSKRFKQLNEQIGKNQPIQKHVYFYSDDEHTKECVNLIEIKHLRKLTIPLPVGTLIKISDGTPYKPRTQAGGWSTVEEVSPELMEAKKTTIDSTLLKDLEIQVKKSLSDSSEDRKKRLNAAKKKPEVIQIISKGYKRNADVIAEVLCRASGICELCNEKAPFIRKKDHTPYLEVHHETPLAKGGEDTIENSLALCPNCHRKEHFGV